MNKITKSFVKKHFPLRTKDSHKNMNGRVLIAAGSQNMPGAAILCAISAYKAGAGFVTLAVPACIAAACAAAVPEALILTCPQNKNGELDKKAVQTIAAWQKQNPHDVLLLGPGLGAGAQVTAALLKKTALPAVIDADALNFLAKAGANTLDKNIPYILTPHAGEMKRLLNKINISENAPKELFDISGAVSLLKGPATKVYFNKQQYQNTTGNEGLAKAGSGDTLAGITAAIFAQLLKKQDKTTPKQRAFLAALLGVFVHGAAADAAAKEYGKVSLMASDVCMQLPYTIKEILK